VRCLLLFLSIIISTWHRLFPFGFLFFYVKGRRIFFFFDLCQWPEGRMPLSVFQPNLDALILQENL